MTSLAQVLSGANPLVDGFSCEVPPDWHQGRTAFGGFSSALALAAAQQVGGVGLPPLRSAQIAFVGPVAGVVTARASVLRQGRNATWISAEIGNDAGVCFTASFAFMGKVASATRVNDCPVPQGLVPVDEALPVAPVAHSPQFIKNHMESRYALPRDTSRRPEQCRWIRLRDRAGLDPMVEVMTVGDALAPGVMALLPLQSRVSSMGWLANMLTPAPATRDGWWLLRSVGEFAEDGCSSQRMQIWNADGVPVVSGMQSIALFD